MDTEISPFEQMRFCFPWRAYQAEVLRGLEDHLEDRKLHVVAAPGAGKTVVGIEVLRRIGKPTLILAPSIAIRNQWVDRLTELFLPDRHLPDWISKDLKAPGLVTVSTYQALHMDCDAATLQAAEVGVVVLDEAHHLRNAWWEALVHIVDTLDAQTVALTATPPYDVTSQEWRRYDDLCGPIDAEISIPELVKSGDLAPHQDLVHYSQLKQAEPYTAMDRRNTELRAQLRGDAAMISVIERHPWIADTRRQANELLSDPSLFSAMLIYLNDADVIVPRYARRVLGVAQRKIPKLNDEWLQILFQGLLEYLPDHLAAHLTKHGALYKSRVSIPLADSEDRERLLRNAPEKYESIREIAEAERKELGKDLRLVILTEHVGAGAVKLAAAEPDYYTPDEFNQRILETPKLGRLDAGSLFERLRAEKVSGGDMAVLTGSLVIVPAAFPGGEGIAVRALPHDPRYVQLHLSGAASDRRVQLVSDLVANGTVRILIGTRALLGQGWDLPAINTLILATNVKSFVSSNQIRGRAIRCDPAQPEKVANIWHVATTAPAEPGPEVEALERRFDTFVHLDTVSGQIKSGLSQHNDPQTANAASLSRAAERDLLTKRWHSALETGTPRPHIQHRIETDQSHRGLVGTDAVAQLLPRTAVAATGMAVWAGLIGDPVPGLLFGTGSAAVMVPGLLRLKRVLAHGTLSESLRQTGLAVLHAMVDAGQIKTERSRLTVSTGVSDAGLAYCTLTGATLPEETRFLSLLEEFFAPIDNPRYIIQRQSYLGRMLRIAPYPVPKALGARKETAQALLDGWQRYVGPAELIYTRTVAGRLALLRARTVTLAEARAVRRSSVWQ